MSIPLLTVGQMAKAPYIFSRLLLSIWSVEELCYLFKTNPFILDKSILDRRLVTWLEGQCGLPDLAKKLNGLLKKSENTEEFVMAIIDYTGYLNDEEAKRVAEILKGNIGLSDYEKEINNADFLLKSGKFQRAKYEYDRIILTIPLSERAFLSRVYHNRGIALAKLFHFEEASAGFLSAFELSQNPESGRAYLISMRLFLDEIDYIRLISDRPAFHDFSLEVEHIYNQAVSVYNETDAKHTLDELILDKELGNGNSYHREIDRMIREAKQSYRFAVE
ncbi:MAG: hypothetical protein FWC09_02525 [Lachnospiraceae bacterium]|nr:hypothetical protein [Lachnospiraceae bacterium]